jgi:uncharacterized integral membrane protein (TIGR00698 family)
MSNLAVGPHWRKILPGLLLTAVLAALAVSLALLPALKNLGLSALPLGILGGILVGHTLFPRIAERAGPGVDIAKGYVLRLGIVLFGFRITFQQIGAVGMTGVLIDAAMVALTFGVAMLIGTRLLKLDRHTAMLIGAGSAICGAAAVMATEPVVRCQPHKVSVAIATVVIFGTLSMFVYPLLFPHLGLSPQQFGVYAGSTIHEVAQVVAAGAGVGDAAAKTAVIEKMLRVMMLAPFLLLLSAALRKENSDCSGQARIIVPWFALLFIAASGINSLHLIGATATAVIAQADMFILAMAMSALGLRTHISAVRQAGVKPLILAALLFCFLSVGGYAVNTLVMRWMA